MGLPSPTATHPGVTHTLHPEIPGVWNTDLSLIL